MKYVLKRGGKMGGSFQIPPAGTGNQIVGNVVYSIQAQPECYTQFNIKLRPRDCTHAGGALRGVCRRHTFTVNQAEHPWEDGEEGQLQRYGSPPFRPDADVSQPDMFCSSARDCVQIFLMLNLCAMYECVFKL